MKLKAGDTVLVTAGKDKGRRGKIERIVTKTGKVVVKGVNLYKRHVKPKGEGQRGGIVSLERPLPVGAVAVICTKCNQPTRIGFEISATGVKQRICRKCGGMI